MRRCTKCGRDLPEAEFYQEKTAKDGLRGDCKACFAARRKRWYDAHRQEEIARVKAWQQANAERHNENQRRRRQRPDVKAKQRAGHLRRKFGITSEDYDRLLAEQGGRCAICRRKPNARISLHVDHEHGTGRVRGLLCFRCNNALGDFDDDPELLTAAARYVLGTR